MWQLEGGTGKFGKLHSVDQFLPYDVIFFSSITVVTITTSHKIRKSRIENF